MQDSILRCRRNSPGRARIEGEWSDCLRNAGAKWCDNGNRGPPELLAPVYEAFTEGFDTPDLRDAKVLLDALA